LVFEKSLSWSYGPEQVRPKASAPTRSMYRLGYDAAPTLLILAPSLVKRAGASAERLVEGDGAEVEEGLDDEPREVVQDDMLLPPKYMSTGATARRAGGQTAIVEVG
jgi:hypothetical protein